ncbi:MAG: GAF domain-containing protein [Oligoflexia bacterium]|nr:GAF domain-containing protein [Oligoflexia bacterium]
MALKKRFTPKQIQTSLTTQTSDQDTSSKKIERPSLSIVSSASPITTITSAITSENHTQIQGSDEHLKKKLVCYHRINELYQNENLQMYELMKGVLEILAYGVCAEGGSLWIYNQNKNNITCKVAIGPGSNTVEGITIPFGKGIVGWVQENKRSTIVNDTSNDERFSNTNDIKSKFQTTSILAAPLLYNSESIGVLELVNRKDVDPHFSETDRHFLDDLATIAAMHIQSSRTKKHNETIMTRMKTFAELHESFCSTMDMQELLNLILEKAIFILGAEVSSIWLEEESQCGNECFAASGPTKDKVLGLKLKKGVGFIGWVIDNKKPIIVEDCSKDNRFSESVDKKIKFATKTMLAAPLLVKDECIGAIQIINKKGSDNLFNNDDLDLLNLFASNSAMYIKNARLFTAEKKAKELSALVKISKDITSTLDLDAVLMSIVNLSSQIIPYDEAACSIEKLGKDSVFELRAQTNKEKVDRENNKNINLEMIHNLFVKEYLKHTTNNRQQANNKEELLQIYIADATTANTAIAESAGSADPSKQMEKQTEISKEIYKYLIENNLKSFWIHILQDDQGAVGIFSMESVAANLINSNKQELLPLLVSQSTVALRNAQLYTTIPSNDILNNVKNNVTKCFSYEYLQTVPKKKLIAVSTAIISLVIAFFFLKLPINVDTDIEILPVVNIHYAQVKSNVEKIHVKEGQFVKKGTLLINLNSTDSQIELKQKEYQWQRVRTEMLKAKSEQKISDYKIKEKEFFSLNYEIELLERKIKFSKVYAMNDGVITSDKLNDLQGMPVNYGQELIKIADMNKIYVQFQVPEKDILAVRVNQEIKFKVYGGPLSSFGDGLKIESLSGEGTQVLEQDKNRYYMARSLIDLQKMHPNTNSTANSNFSALKAGMTGRGKIYTDWQAIGPSIAKFAARYLMMEFIF